MSQLNLYLPDNLGKVLRQKAKKQKLSLSALVAELIKKGLGFERDTSPADANGWPKDFFTKVCGSWQGEFPEIEALPFEARDDL